MENEVIKHVYTKGDRDFIVKRIDSIHTITVFCPIQDDGMKCFRKQLIISLLSYMKNENFGLVPVYDVFTCFMECVNFCKIENIDVKNLYSFYGIVQSFSNLKYINIVFSNDFELLKSYEDVRSLDKKENVYDVVRKIYKVEVVEIILCNLFKQEFIDILNKVLMFDEIIANSYLEREFEIVFNFDEYISYFEMFYSNNSLELSKLDEYVWDYISLFPKLITQQKPLIKLVTNYVDI